MAVAWLVRLYAEGVAVMRERWVPFATAPDQPTAEAWCQLIRNAGCPAMAKSDNVPFLGETAMPVRLMTLIERADEAREVLSRYVNYSV